MVRSLLLLLFLTDLIIPYFLVVGKANHSFRCITLTKTEGLQILGGVALLEAFYAGQRAALAQLQSL